MAVEASAHSVMAVASEGTGPECRNLMRYRRIGLQMAVGEGTLFALATLISQGLTRHPLPSLRLELGSAGAIAALEISLFWMARLYRLRQISSVDEFRRLLAATAAGLMVVGGVSYWARWPIPRDWTISTFALILFFALASRKLWHHWIRRARARGELRLRTVIIGTNDQGRRLARSLQTAESTFEPVGFVRGDEAASGPWLDGLPVLGDVQQIRDLVSMAAAECVFVAASAVPAELTAPLLRAIREDDMEVRIQSNLPEILLSRVSIQPIENVPSLLVRPARLTGPQATLKRTFDLMTASILLAASTPVWLVTMVLIKATSRGPVLYRQVRIGRHGRPFTIYKFRSMHCGADEMLDQVRDLNEASGPLFKIRNDPRVTWFGRFLRRTSLDELPQILNVVKGDMSLVGPRPPLPEEVSLYQDWHYRRLEVRPGMTGLGQISGRSELTFEELVRRDLFYIENWSLPYDLFLLAKTIPVTVSGRGAY